MKCKDEQQNEYTFTVRVRLNIALPKYGQDQHSSEHFISTGHLLFWGLTSIYSQTAAMQNVVSKLWAVMLKNAIFE